MFLGKEEYVMESPRHVVVVGCLVRNADSKVLLIRHHRRGWEIPQGRVEEGEGVIEALHREVLEETGVTVTVGPLACVWSKLNPPAALILGFVATYLQGELTPSDETPELGWFTADEALSLVDSQVSRERLACLLAYAGTTGFSTYTTNPYRKVAELFPEPLS